MTTAPTPLFRDRNAGRGSKVTSMITSIVTLLAVSLACLGVATTLPAQTRFARPDTTFDLGQYRYVEDCIVAVKRVQTEVVQESPVWADTTLETQSLYLDTLTTKAVAAARTCSAKFDPQTVPLDAYAEWIQLFLLANRDDASEIVVRRATQDVKQRHPNSPRELYYALSKMRARYASAQPIRWQNIVGLTTQLTERSVSQTARDLLTAYELTFRLAEEVGDTAVRSQSAEQIVAISKTMTPAEQESKWYKEEGRGIVAAALDHFVEIALMDSLRRSSEAYVALREANWVQARGNNTDPIPEIVGVLAPPIVADFWTPRDSRDNPGTSATFNASFQHQSSQPVRPARGKISLVVFLYGECRSEAPIIHSEKMRRTRNANCWPAYSAMRRLAARYPGMELILVSKTTGYVGMTPPMTPAEEAETMRSWWLDFHRIPATLAVVNTPFFRLEEPDLRRIDRPTETMDAYRFDRLSHIGSGMAYVVDTNGMVIYANQLRKQTEKKFRKFLDVMTSR